MARGKKGTGGAPGAHFAESVSPHHENELIVFEAFGQGDEGIDQVGGPGPFDLDGIGEERGIVSHGEFDPGHAVPGGCDGIALRLLMRGPCAGNEEHARKAELADDLFGRAQVTPVDRVEGTAVDSDHRSRRHPRVRVQSSRITRSSRWMTSEPFE